MGVSYFLGTRTKKVPVLRLKYCCGHLDIVIFQQGALCVLFAPISANCTSGAIALCACDRIQTTSRS